MSRKRSDSSKTLRQQLVKDYVVVPAVSPIIDVSRYVAIAKIAQEEARKSAKRQEYSRAYVDYRKFMDLAMKIAKHPSYPSRADVQQWYRAETSATFNELEDVVAAMDEIQDKILEAYIDRQLMAALDGDFGDDFSPTPSSQSSPSAPTLPAVYNYSAPALPHPEAEGEDPFSVFTRATSASVLATAPPPPEALEEDEEAKRKRRQERIRAAFFVPNYEGETLDSVENASPETSTSIYPPVESLSLAPVSTMRSTPAPLSSTSSSGAISPSSTVVGRLKPVAHTLSREEALLLSALTAYARGTVPPSGPLTFQTQQWLRQFRVPFPAITDLEFIIGDTSTMPVTVQGPPGLVYYRLPNSQKIQTRFSCHQDDFHASFVPLLTPTLTEVLATSLPILDSLVISPTVCESNRCFFLHLGIATGIHPYLLQVYFRAMAFCLIEESKQRGESSPWYLDIVQSVRDYAGFVDAQVLAFIWPRELDRFKLCFLSGSRESPVISVFNPPQGTHISPTATTEVLIYCNGSHFSLLRPRRTSTTGAGGGDAAFQVIDALCAEAKRLGRSVQQFTAFDLLIEEEQARGPASVSLRDVQQRVREKYGQSVWETADQLVKLCSSPSS